MEEKRKSELTSWWLTYSEKRVEAFLKELGYIFEVVPDDYTGYFLIFFSFFFLFFLYIFFF